jgi:hypothetical protein
MPDDIFDYIDESIAMLREQMEIEAENDTLRMEMAGVDCWDDFS